MDKYDSEAAVLLPCGEFFNCTQIYHFGLCTALKRIVVAAALRAQGEKLAEQEKRIGELELELGMRDSVLAMTVSRLGGLVEGRPTARVNFLQRVDELRGVEVRLAEAEGLLARRPHIWEQERKHVEDYCREYGGACATLTLRVDDTHHSGHPGRPEEKL